VTGRASGKSYSSAARREKKNDATEGDGALPPGLEIFKSSSSSRGRLACRRGVYQTINHVPSRTISVTINICLGADNGIARSRSRLADVPPRLASFGESKERLGDRRVQGSRGKPNRGALTRNASFTRAPGYPRASGPGSGISPRLLSSTAEAPCPRRCRAVYPQLCMRPPRATILYTFYPASHFDEIHMAG